MASQSEWDNDRFMECAKKAGAAFLNRRPDLKYNPTLDSPAKSRKKARRK